MIRLSVFRFILALGFIVSVLHSNQAFAGPPLLCYPIEIGSAKSLPGGSFRFGVSASYDRSNLVSETLALLTDKMPVLVRMETIRRAAVYATNFHNRVRKSNNTDEDRKTAYDLLAQLKERAKTASKSSQAFALFDLGYYTECLRQSGIGEGFEGFHLMTKALELRGSDPEMEFACALAAVWPKRDSQKAHLERARAAASEGSLLKKNLELHFGKS